MRTSPSALLGILSRYGAHGKGAARMASGDVRLGPLQA